MISAYDILIVGGGPAGSAAAACAVGSGLKTCLIDKATFPRDKVCGDLIIVDALQVFQQNGFDISDLFLSSIKTRSFVFSEQMKNDLKVDLQNAEHLLCQYKRKDFDMYLLSKVATRIDTYMGYVIGSIERADDIYQVLLKNKAGNDTTVVHAKYIVGADGSSSFVRRNFFGDFHLEYGIATREYCKASLDKYECLVYYFSEIEYGGYFWVFPMSDIEVNCGIVLYTEQWKKKFKTIQEAHNYYKEEILRESAVKDNINTWSLPLNTSIQECCKENVLLVGDAAGLIHPFLGHGIDTAIYSANVALKHIIAHIADEQYDINRMYSEEINEKFIVPNIRFKQYRQMHMAVNDEFIRKLQHLLLDIQELYASYLKAL